jgi:hypothetical protein
MDVRKCQTLTASPAKPGGLPGSARATERVRQLTSLDVGLHDPASSTENGFTVSLDGRYVQYRRSASTGDLMLLESFRCRSDWGSIRGIAIRKRELWRGNGPVPPRGSNLPEPPQLRSSCLIIHGSNPKTG